MATDKQVEALAEKIWNSGRYVGRKWGYASILNKQPFLQFARFLNDSGVLEKYDFIKELNGSHSDMITGRQVFIEAKNAAVDKLWGEE